MNGTPLDEQCAIIRQSGTNTTNEKLKIALDLFVGEMKRSFMSKIDYGLIDQIVSSLNTLPSRSKQLTDVELIEHEFFFILRDSVIIEHFRRRHIPNNLTDRVLFDVSILFMNLCYNVNDNNAVALKYLLFHQSLIEELAQCLNEMSTYGQHLNDPVLCRSLSCLLTALKHYQVKLIITDEYALSTPIFCAVSQCLSSSYARMMIHKLERNFTQKLDHQQVLFLDTITSYLQWYSDYQDLTKFVQVIRSLLNEYTVWFTSCPPELYLQCSEEMAAMIRHLNYFLVRPIESGDMTIFSVEFYHDYCRLVSHWIFILSATVAHPSSDMNMSCTRTIAEMLYNFTLHVNVLNYAKTMPDLIVMLLKLTGVDHDGVQLNAYRCLGRLMREADIKALANPKKIAGVYVDFLTINVDDRQYIRRFYSILESLKNFVQHDQVKTELIQQAALPVLVKCVVETRFDPIKVQLVALEILLALSFNNEACSILRKDLNFINHIRQLSSKTDSNRAGIQRAAEGLLWKLEEEEVAVAKSNNVNCCKYDIMISYSHKDQEICLQIHEQLVRDGYQVWVDRDCLRGPTMIGIAKAIENSEYVLICVSNAYKQSVYCQSEAHYAFERRCRLIPIIVEPNYKPDGWLGIIVCGKLYVNFGKLAFQTAYQKLKDEISERRHENRTASVSSWRGKDEIHLVCDDNETSRVVSVPIRGLPTYITKWTHDHVHFFLSQRKMDKTILSLCPHFDGSRLLSLYEMCQLNRESMYQSLKFELHSRHQRLLPIGDYLTFLHEIKQYVPTTPTNARTRQSSPFSLTFCSIC